MKMANRDEAAVTIADQQPEPQQQSSPENSSTQPRQSRRRFLTLAASTVSSLALTRFAPRASAQGACTAQQQQALAKIGEITSSAGYLQGVIDLTVRERAVSYYAAPIFACDKHRLRAYQGYRGFSVAPANQVFSNAQMAVEGPGPTLRLGVGETLELIFLNRIYPAQFNKTSVTSSLGKCDTTTGAPGGTGANYPGKDASNFPNCFHASNTTNIHWHGTHTHPTGFGDNVLVGVLPNHRMNVQTAILRCQQAFRAWNAGQDPTKTLIGAGAADLNNMYQAAVLAKNQDLAAQLKAAIQVNDTERKQIPPEFPQYWPGFFPYHVELPKWSGSLSQTPRMGQSPGTHWYHCHQHGSTTLQLLNGMAGALIITDNSPTGYDGRLNSLGYKEQVMIMQLFSEQPNQINASPSAAQVAVNGQIVPTVTMKPGEVQWWRMINACMNADGIQRFIMVDEATFNTYVANAGTNAGAPSGPLPKIPAGTAPSLNQCAQDGVQFHWKNFQRMLNAPSFRMAPGNRCDFLAQAPVKPGVSYLVFWSGINRPAPKDIRTNTILKVVVSGDASSQQLPTEAQYPQQPGFLVDITDAEVHGRHQEADFSMKGGPGSQPFFYIDGKQFQEGVIDHTMQLDTAEEWLLTNSSLKSITHPFHIHINPFQVVEVYNPLPVSQGGMTPDGQQPNPARDAQKLPGPWIWWDVISIPAGVQLPSPVPGLTVTDANGNPVVPGYIRMRSRFVDYIGKYVLHCHILGHEDRGMMQMVQVVSGKTVVKHH